MSESPLKNHSLVEIEAAIAKALTDLCGTPVMVDVGSLVHDPNSWAVWSVDLKVNVRQPPIDAKGAPF